MKTILCRLAFSSAFLFLGGEVRAQGNLTPPGAPAPTMKSLDQIEPRTPISSLPFTITNSGSYYLTANLTGASGSRGITVSANDVTIDLKGFSLVGVPGSLEGLVLSGAITNVTVGNGVIRNWGAHGINGSGGNGCIFQGLRILNNGNIGISAGSATTVKDCLVEGNNTYGILVGESSVISGCTARTNSNGISASHGSVVTGCSSVANLNYGIYVNSGVTVQSCSVRGNGGLGIAISEGSSAIGCSSTQNGSYGIWVFGNGAIVSGCTVSANLSDGINLNSGGARIVDNSCLFNGPVGSTNFAGIRVDSSGNRIEGNNLIGNRGRGLRVAAVGNFIVRNSASFNTVHYDITGAQTIGPIVTSGTITTSNPWANFEF